MTQYYRIRYQNNSEDDFELTVNRSILNISDNIFKKLTNQKQELSVAAMFVNGSGRNEQSL